MLGYIKIGPYIVYLEILEKDMICDWIEDEPHINTEFKAKRGKVIKIEHIATKETIKEIKRKMRNGSTQQFCENCWFNIMFYFFRTYDRAFFEDFMKKSQHRLFENGYAGPCLSYYPNGQIEYEGTITNGQAIGLMIKYFQNGKIEQEGTSINGQRNGEFKLFTQDPIYKLKIHRLYIDNRIEKDYLCDS
jgi:antitoxin component YwqK of YwqJK toxin-antitoxin module